MDDIFDFVYVDDDFAMEDGVWGGLPQYLGNAGTIATWIGFGLSSLTLLGIVISAWKIPVSRRVIHTVAALTALATTLSYLSVVTGHGFTPLCHVQATIPEKPELVQACQWDNEDRALEWYITTALLLFNLSLVSGQAGISTLVSVISSFIVIKGIRLATSEESSEVDLRRSHWVWVVVVILAYITTLWGVLGQGAHAAKARGARAQKLYYSVALIVVIFWTVNLGIWIGSVANDSIQQDNAAVAILVVDFVLKLATGGVFALAHSRVPGFAVELDGYWANGLPSEGRIRVGDDEEE